MNLCGDRGTGKTAIALECYFEPKEKAKDVICIYVAIGQKNLPRVVQKLEETGRYRLYSIIICSCIYW